MSRPNTRLLEMKQSHYEANFGTLAPEECLELAIEHDCTANACGVYDPAYARFKEISRKLIDYAEVLEWLKQSA